MRRFDARAKILGAAMIILAISTLDKPEPLALAIIISLSLVPALGISIREHVKILAYPLLLAVFIAIVQAATVGSTQIGNLSLYWEGLHIGVVIALRVISAVSVFSLLTSTTEREVLLDTLRGLGVPPAVVDVASLMTRYVGLLGSEASTMLKAQRSRCLSSAPHRRRLQSHGAMAGAVLVRSLDRAEKVGRAMTSRCHSYAPRKLTPLSMWDFGFIALSTMLSIVIIQIDLIW